MDAASPMTKFWTPVALSQDIPAGAATPAQLGENDLVVWRTASGRINAWSDRCPHRGMRLSHGFVRGEFLSCIYHGWRYGDGGQCHKIPAHPDLTPPDAIKVPVFVAVEVSGVVWVAETGVVPDDAPVACPGFAPFRSLRLDCAADVLSAALGDTASPVRLGPCEVVALVQPLTEASCNLHLLAPEEAELAVLDQLSTAAEALRNRLEAQERVAA
jgi:nitrite reductase/ring-hydroxylating ferredoxin subunit